MLSIMIVNYNTAQYTLSCIKSILTNEVGENYEILVLDNGSNDGVRELVEGLPHVKCFEENKNSGFAGGNNYLAKYAAGDVYLFLNPDVMVIQKSSIKTMIKEIRGNSECGALGSRLVDEDGSFQLSSAQRFPNLYNQIFTTRLLIKYFPKYFGSYKITKYDQNIIQVDVISGACLMVRKEAFLEVGGWNEDYFLFSEDVELCWKLVKYGYCNYLLPGVSYLHTGGGSEVGSGVSKKRVAFQRTSRHIFFKNTKGSTYAGLYRILILINGVLKIVLALPVIAIRGKNKRNNMIQNSLWKNYYNVLWASGCNSVNNYYSRKTW